MFKNGSRENILNYTTSLKQALETTPLLWNQ